MPTVDLDDTNQTCIFLPFEPSDDNQLSTNDTSYYGRDLPDGHELRMQAYREAWSKCLKQIQTILKTLYTPVVSEVVHHIYQAYSVALPGLPYAEIPAVILNTQGAGESLYSDILQELERDYNEDKNMSGYSNGGHPKALLNHIYPSDCPNVTSAMRHMISEFVDKPINDDQGPIKRRAAASLVNHDISLLDSWYDMVRTIYDPPPQLVVSFHDFEQFDVGVVEDLFYICSLHVPKIPLVFILAMSSPRMLSFLHSTYSRSTLSLLRIHSIVSPSGPAIIEDILVKTFFNADFEPPILLGSAALEFIIDFCTREEGSLDTVITLLQLAYMKHFEEPLTIFVHNRLLGTRDLNVAAEKLRHPSSFQFLDALFSRLSIIRSPNLNPSSTSKVSEQWAAMDTPMLLESVSSAHAEVRRCARNLCIAFQVTRTVQRSMKRLGIKGGDERGGLQMLRAISRGRAGRDIKYLGLIIKKMSIAQLGSLLEDLHRLFRNIKSPLLRHEEEAIRVKVVAAIASLPQDPVAVNDFGINTSTTTELSTDISEWLVEYLESRLVRLDECPLSDIWYSGLTPFPSELINPAPRLSIESALLHPHDFIDTHTKHISPACGTDLEGLDASGPQRAHSALWELPDTSILFRRYMDAGKMINVYDWFQSFDMALESQRRHHRRRAKINGKGLGGTPSRRKGKGREQLLSDMDIDKQSEAEDESDLEDEENMEKWRVEVQARFIRALHELDYMGFIKHTGRKADHVVRTVYDVPD